MFIYNLVKLKLTQLLKMSSSWRSNYRRKMSTNHHHWIHLSLTSFPNSDFPHFLTTLRSWLKLKVNLSIEINRVRQSPILTSSCVRTPHLTKSSFQLISINRDAITFTKTSVQRSNAVHGQQVKSLHSSSVEDHI